MVVTMIMKSKLRRDFDCNRLIAACKTAIHYYLQKRYVNDGNEQLFLLRITPLLRMKSGRERATSMLLKELRSQWTENVI